MPPAILYLDPDSKLNLQNQLRQKLVDGILSGAFPPGSKLPSSRGLAAQLNVARNTVVLVYQQLVAEGYLITRQRSGLFVNPEMLSTRVGHGGAATAQDSKRRSLWRRRIRNPVASARSARDLPNWRKYPYPFIDGHFEPSLFPLAEWREACRLSMSVADVRDWSTGNGDADDPMLVNEILTKILTRRGIHAKPDEILVTLGTQHGLYIISQLLADRNTVVAMEEPGKGELRHVLQQQQARMVYQPVDCEGLVVDGRLADADLVYVTPSHQIPTAVVMSPDRRKALLQAARDHDFLVIEDDYECEINYLDHPHAALRSMDTDGRVIYVAGLSNVLATGVRLGFIVADAEFIQHARDLRRAMLRHPPRNNQRAVAFFLSLGHYDALMSRLARVLQVRRLALRDALNFYRSVSIEISPEVGGTTYWVRLPPDFSAEHLASEAERRGILIEPVANYYSDPSRAENCFRMGVTSLPLERIRPGVVELTELIRKLGSGRMEQLETSVGEWLTGDELHRAMSGTTIIYNVVYGVPCTIELHADGTMVGTAGYSNEDCDVGRWWVEGDRWHRQWQQWVYGEAAAYYVVIDDDQVKWFNEAHQLVDRAFIRAMVGPQ